MRGRTAIGRSRRLNGRGPHCSTAVNTGLKEPGTGEINYRGEFKCIHDRSKRENRDFVIGMEHGNSKPGRAGEEAVIQSYRDADAFSS